MQLAINLKAFIPFHFIENNLKRGNDVFMTQTASKGDFLLLNFEGKLEDGMVFEKTPPNRPTLVVAGEGNLIQGLDKAIIGMFSGEHKHSVFSPVDSFGERNEELVKLVSISQFKKSNVQPQVGMTVELDGHRAKIQSVEGGRVKVDFNHELAGRTLQYDYSIDSIYSTTLAKVEAAAKSILNVEKQNVMLNGKIAKITVPNKINKDANYFIAKSKLVSMLLANINDLIKVEIVEEFEKNPHHSSIQNQEAPKTIQPVTSV